MSDGGSQRSIHRRVAAVGRAGNHLLEGVAHRHIEVEALGWDRLEEPLVVDRVDRAAAIGGDHGLIDDFLERGPIVAPAGTRADRQKVVSRAGRWLQNQAPLSAFGYRLEVVFGGLSR